MNTGEYFSSGKFLITAEYLVLRGALALAVPLKKGQHMKVMVGRRESVLGWDAQVLGNKWFRADFSLPALKILYTSDLKLAETLKHILEASRNLAPDRFKAGKSYQVMTELEFDVHWGMGSSSSLVSNIAWWLGIDPFELFKLIYPGSGYDVFCARSGKPILYCLVNGLPSVTEVDFKPPFRENLSFIYLGTKQDSQKSVLEFSNRQSIPDRLIHDVSELTGQALNSTDLEEFQRILLSHEEKISSILGIPPVGKDQFPDFPGVVKSLGAWGGDFIMAASSGPFDETADYFYGKGFPVIFKYDDLVPDF